MASCARMIVHSILILLTCFTFTSECHSTNQVKISSMFSSRVLTLVPRGGAIDNVSKAKKTIVKKSVWHQVIKKLTFLLKSFLSLDTPPSKDTKTHLTFAESIQKYINECEIKGNTIEKRKLFMEGSFAACLNKARLEGKPLLIALIPTHGLASKRAMVDQSVDKVLKKEGIKIWGSFPTGRDAALVRRLLKVTSKLDPTFALVRPHQKGSEFSILGQFPPSRGVVQVKIVKGRRLSSWITSTLQRFRDELAQDAKCAGDRSVEEEVKVKFKETLAMDMAEQDRQRQLLKTRLETEAAALQLSEATDLRRNATLKALQAEPEDEEGVITVAVRLPSGIRVSRRFYTHYETKTLFDWLDAFHQLPLVDGMRLKSGDGSFTCQYGGESQQLSQAVLSDKRILLNIEYA